jgi:hypothetical protein
LDIETGTRDLAQKWDILRLAELLEVVQDVVEGFVSIISDVDISSKLDQLCQGPRVQLFWKTDTQIRLGPSGREERKEGAFSGQVLGVQLGSAAYEDFDHPGFQGVYQVRRRVLLHGRAGVGASAPDLRKI